MNSCPSMQTSSNFHQSFTALKALLNKRRVDLNQKHYVIVPDKCSIFVEGILFESGGAFDIEVLTFERLELKLNKSNIASLSNVGAVMMIKQILFKFKSDLTVFRRAAEHKGLAEKLYDSICAASDSGLTPDDLRLAEQNSSGKKLADIALVWQEFLCRTKDKFVDSAGKMKLLLQELKETNLTNIHFYVAGFDRYTAIELEILEALKQHSASFNYFSVGEPPKSFGEVEFYESSEVASRVKEIARQIRARLIAGDKTCNMAVLAESGDFSSIERIFSEYDIPFYIDKQLKLSQTELYRFIEASFNATNFKRQEYFLALAKNYYINIENNDQYIFENYVLEHCINYNDFFAPFNKRNEREDKNEARQEAEKVAENVRARLANYLNWFASRTSMITTGADFEAFINEVFDKICATDKTKELANILGLELISIVDKFLNVATLTKTVCDNNSIGFKKLYKLFTEGLSASAVSLMPAYMGNIVVGSPNALRGGKFKRLFVINFIEGACPALNGDTALIARSDMAILDKCGKKFEPTPHQLNHYSLVEVLRLFNLCDSLFLGYSNTANSRISSLENLVKTNSKKYKYTKNTSCQLKTPLTKYEALELLATNCDVLLNADNNAMLKSVFSNEQLQRINKKDIAARLPLKQAGQLFFNRDSVSISKVQKYFECPYKSFVENILELKPRDTGEVKPLEVGSFLHRAAEVFVAHGGEFSAPKTNMENIVDDLSKHEYAWLKDKNAPFLNRLKQEALRLAEPIAASFTKGNFKNKYVEVAFGTGESHSLDTIKFTVDNDETVYTKNYKDKKSIKSKIVSLRGVIDRVDTVNYNGKTHGRVIDYKSSNFIKTHGTIVRDTYYGLSLQLPLYGKILEQNGIKNAGVFYFLLSANFSDDPKKRKLHGFYLNENDMLVAYDSALSEIPSNSELINAVRTNKGELHGSWSKPYAYSNDELKSFGNYACAAMQNSLNEIARGNIAPSPYKINNKSPCDYCIAKEFCGFDNESFRELEKVAREQLYNLNEI